MSEALTLEQWFDTFYPESWGDWRTHYNIKAYRSNRGETACTWMCYSGAYLVYSEDSNGLMKLTKSSYPAMEVFFVPCGTSAEEHKVDWFIQPYFQRKNSTYYAKIKVTKEESNLDLYRVYISGCDDSSYTKHFLSAESVQQEIEYLKAFGISDIQSREYFFTN